MTKNNENSIKRHEDEASHATNRMFLIWGGLGGLTALLLYWVL